MVRNESYNAISMIILKSANIDSNTLNRKIVSKQTPKQSCYIMKIMWNRLFFSLTFLATIIWSRSGYRATPWNRCR